MPPSMKNDSDRTLLKELSSKGDFCDKAPAEKSWLTKKWPKNEDHRERPNKKQ